MSSYWGHGAAGEQAGESRRSSRRAARRRADRRASLPCSSQLDAMQLTRLHTTTMAPVPVLLKPRDEKEVRSHPRARRASSDDINHSKAALPESRITTIPELSESFERRLHFCNHKVMSLSDGDNLCLICHEDLKNGGVQELHCSHRFHKECIEEWMWKKQACPTCHAHAAMPQPLYWSSARVQFPGLPPHSPLARPPPVPACNSTDLLPTRCAKRGPTLVSVGGGCPAKAGEHGRPTELSSNVPPSDPRQPVTLWGGFEGTD